MKHTITQYRLNTEIISFIEDSVIEDMPLSCPSFLNKFYVFFETPIRNIRALWGGFEENYLIICGERNVSGGYVSAIFFIDFEKQKYDFGNKETLYEGVKVDNDEGLFFIKFLLTFGLLLEAEKSPLCMKTENQRCAINLFGKRLTKIVSKISFKPKFVQKIKEYSLVHVRGFLRRQACGKSWSEHKIVYIAPFERFQKTNQNKR